MVADDFEIRFADKYRGLAAFHSKAFGVDMNEVELEIGNYKMLAEKIRPFVDETVSYLHESIKSGSKILVEGANASMLDIGKEHL